MSEKSKRLYSSVEAYLRAGFDPSMYKGLCQGEMNHQIVKVSDLVPSKPVIPYINWEWLMKQDSKLITWYKEYIQGALQVWRKPEQHGTGRQEYYVKYFTNILDEISNYLKKP